MIRDDEAIVIREICELCADGFGYKSIAGILNRKVTLTWAGITENLAIEYPLKNLPLEAHYIWAPGDTRSPDPMNYSEYFVETTHLSVFGDTDRLRAMNANFQSFEPSIVWPSDPIRQRAVQVIGLPPGMLPAGVDGATFSRCLSPTIGGDSPNDTQFVAVVPASIQSNGASFHPGDNTDNEIKYVVAHELGHAVHVKHRAAPNGPPVVHYCDDGASEGPASVQSAMSDGWGGGPGIFDPRANYDPTLDVPQIRVK